MITANCSLHEGASKSEAVKRLRSIKLSKPVVACGVLAAVAAVAAGVMGGMAVADDATVKALAPYAQASGLFNPDGTRLYSKGIKSFTKVNPGEYCVTFDDVTRINVARSTPVATLYPVGGTAPWGWTVYTATQPTATCNNAADAITVYVGSNSGPADNPFFLVVP